MTAPTPNRPAVRYTLYAALALVAFLAFLVVRPFLVTIAVAISAAVILAPLTGWITRLLGGRRGLASLLTVGIVTVAVLGPLLAYGALIGEQATRLLEWARPRLQPAELKLLITETLPQRLPWVERLRAATGLDDQKLAEFGSQALSRVVSVLRELIQGALAQVATTVFQLVLFVILLFFLLRDGPLFAGEVRALLPLSERQESAALDHLSRTIRGVLLATVIVPLAQGVLAVVGFALFGIPDAFFWGAMLVFAALIPGIGATLVWAPCALYLFFSRSSAAGIGLAAYGAFGISAIDNVIKPVLLRESARIHPLLGFLSSLGGVLAFGVSGFLLGPVVLSLLLSAIRIWREHVSDLAPPVSPAVPPPPAPPATAATP